MAPWVFRWVLVLLVAALPWGCGGETGGGGPSSGLPPDLTLGDAMEEEQSRFCRALTTYAYGRDLQSQLCELVVLGVQPPEDCDRLVADCRAALTPEALAAAAEGELASCVAGLQELECDATVGELERCITASASKIRAFVTRLSCESREEEIVREAERLQDSECAAVFGSCPALDSSSSDCCDESDPCLWADDAVCDCPGQQWDAADCG